MGHILDYDADVIFITETWMPDETNDITATIKSHAYKLLHNRGKDREKTLGGGVGTMLKDTIECKKSDPGSFRPISLLCNLGKVLESIVTTRLYSWAESTNLLPPEQSGFRKKRSVNETLSTYTDRCATICQTPNSTFRGNLPRRREGV